MLFPGPDELRRTMQVLSWVGHVGDGLKACWCEVGSRPDQGFLEKRIGLMGRDHWEIWGVPWLPGPSVDLVR